MTLSTVAQQERTFVETTLQPMALLAGLDEAVEIFLDGFASGVSNAIEELGSSVPESERNDVAEALVVQLRSNPQAFAAVCEHVRSLVLDFRRASAARAIGSGGRKAKRKGADRAQLPKNGERS